MTRDKQVVPGVRGEFQVIVATLMRTLAGGPSRTSGRELDLERNTYYEHRRDELERRDLLQLAASVADAFAERATLAQDTLNAVIASALIPDSTPEIVQYRDRLAMVGYVWKPPGAGDRWQPGIPSLMRYIRPR